MLRKSTALTATVTALISLLNLDTSKPITLGLSKAVTSGDTFGVYGTLDSAATTTTNATQIGTISGTSPAQVLDGIANEARNWPYVFLSRTAGTTAGTFYLTGEETTAAATVQSAAAAAVASYTTVLDFTSYGATGVRVGSSKDMTTGDVFDVYVTQDSTVTSSTGCQYLGRISGGGGANLTSLVCYGYPYAIVQTYARSTAGGNILAAGVLAPATGSTGWVNGGNAFGAAGSVGTTDAFDMAVIGNNVSFLSYTLSVPVISLGIQATTHGLALLAGSGGIFSSATGPIDFQLGAGLLVRVLPSGVAAGQTGGIALFELAANGTNFIGWKAPDALAASITYVAPAAPTINGQSLRSTTAGVQTWGGAVNVNATKGSAQAIADGSAGIPITGYTEVTDTAAAFDPAAGTFTVPAGGTGFYDITATVQFAATAANLGALFEVAIAVNGAAVANTAYANPVAALAQVRSLTVSRAMQLTAGQVVSVRVSLTGAGGPISTTASDPNNGLSIFQV